MKKWLVIALACVLVLGGGGVGYAFKHSADVKHARQQRFKEAHERAEHAYQARVSRWRQDMAAWREAMDAWQTKQDAYDKCKSDTEEAFSALDDLDGKLVGGLNYDDYSDAVGETVGAVNRAERQADCYEVTSKLYNAARQYGLAADKWRTWFNNLDDTRSLDDLDLQAYWDKASSAAARAQGALAAMKPIDKPGPAPEKPSRRDQTATGVHI